METRSISIKISRAPSALPVPRPISLLAALLTVLPTACAPTHQAPSAPDPAPPHAAAPHADTKPADPSISLFNGKDLSGWTQRGGKAAYFVEEGAIVGESRPGQPNSFLCTERVYADFILELDFIADTDANSGIQIRSNSVPDYKNGQVHGYQVEIDTTDRAWTGGIYDEGRRGWLAPLDKNPAARAAFKQGQWNHFRIECRADHIQTWLNAVPCADLRDSMTASGFIALQVHGVGDRKDPLRVRWKNIVLTDLTK
ncbi:MAG: DUF1080 domain-containing protein [Phycisphaerae bacterium]|nr:DUF1080 domain-containing protein [Phycisphaerae bacterium]